MPRWMLPLLCAAAVSVAVAAPWALAAGAQARAPEPSPAIPIAEAISTITGIAISPLLGTGAYGAYRWWKAGNEANRQSLPWFAQMKFWLPALLIAGLCAAKDAAGTALPVELKKPFDVLEAFENKLSGLVAAGAVVPITVDAFVNTMLSHEAVAAGPVVTASGFAAVQIAAMDASWLVNAVAIPIGVVIFAVVWLASHAINVLILLSPWGAIDAALKAARTSLMGAVVVTAAIDPWMGAFFSLLIIIVAYFLAGWAFRLTVYGTLFCWDFLTLRSRRFEPRENDNPMFAGAFLPGVPVRTYGRLVQRTEGGLQFFYRPWPWRSVKTAPVPEPQGKHVVGRGLFFSEINASDGRTLFLLPPRYRGHEETLARAYQLAGVQPVGLHKAWSEIREMFGGRAVREQKVES